MKQLSKRIVFLLFFCVTTFLYFSCTQEKEFVNEHNHLKIDFKEASFKEALSMPVFNDAYQRVAKKKGAFKSSDEARTALEEQFGFTIVEDAPIRIVTDENGTIFYTILIEREVKEELVFENLMIKVEDEETAAAIFKYTMTEKGTMIDSNNYSINGISSTEYTDLNIESRVFYNAGGETCSIINVLLCDTADHRPAGHIATSSCWNGNGNMIYFGTALACTNNEQTGGGEDVGVGGDSSNSTGGVGASGADPDPVPVSPIICHTGNCIDMDIVDPCDKITAKTNDSIYKAKIIALNTNESFNLTHETGFVEITVAGNPTYPNIGSVGLTSSEIPAGSKNFTHVHVNKPRLNSLDYMTDMSIKIHSPRDLVELLTTVSNANTTSGGSASDSFGIMLSDEGLFSLNIVDENINLGDVNLGFPKFKEKYNKLAGDIISDLNLSASQRKEKLQIMLLSLLKTIGLDNKVALFEGLVLNVGTTKKIKWTKKTLNNGVLIATPCP